MRKWRYDVFADASRSAVGQTVPEVRYVLTEPLNSQRWNSYSYALNNPLRYTDPTGWDESDAAERVAPMLETNGPSDPAQSVAWTCSGTGPGCMGQITPSAPTGSPLPTVPEQTTASKAADVAVGAAEGIGALTAEAGAALEAAEAEGAAVAGAARGGSRGCASRTLQTDRHGFEASDGHSEARTTQGRIDAPVYSVTTYDRGNHESRQGCARSGRCSWGSSLGRSRHFPRISGNLGARDGSEDQHNFSIQFPMVHFKYDPNAQLTVTKLIYVPDDYAFSVEPRPKDCALSVSVNELQLMVDEDDGRVVFVEGYCPHFGWKSRRLVAPPARQAGLFIDSYEQLIPGVSRRVSGEDRWPALVDPGSGWVCVGTESASDPEITIEFAPGALAMLNDGQLIALWLHPATLPILFS